MENRPNVRIRAVRDGAALFLRLPYSRQSLNPGVIGRVGDTLVETIPGATGDYRVDLAFTIGLYPPSSLDGLYKHLGSGDDQARLLAVQALGRLGKEESLDAVRRRKRDSEVTVREAAYVAEGSIMAASTLRALIAARSGPSSPGQGVRDPVAEREKAKKRLGMP